MNLVFSKIIKLYLLPITLFFLGIILLLPAILGASTQSPTGVATATPEHQGYLPIVVKPGDTPTPTPTVTPTATPTSTFIPANLVIGELKMISTPPIIEHEPLEFEVVITNTGEVDINHPFAVNLYINPTPEGEPTPIIRDIHHYNYIFVDSLHGASSLKLNITAQEGFYDASKFINREATFLIKADEADQIQESHEQDNYASLMFDPADLAARQPPWVPTATPNGHYEIMGQLKYTDTNQARNQYFVLVNLVDEDSNIVAQDFSSYDFFISGSFNFLSIPPGNYTVVACFIQYGDNYYWERAISVPDDNGFLIFREAGACPLNLP